MEWPDFQHEIVFYSILGSLSAIFLLWLLISFRQSQKITERCRQIGTFPSIYTTYSCFKAYMEISQHVHPETDGRRVYKAGVNRKINQDTK